MQAQAAGDVELTSKEQLRKILNIVSQLAHNKTKQETAPRLADDKAKQDAAASTQTTASTGEAAAEQAAAEQAAAGQAAAEQVTQNAAEAKAALDRAAAEQAAAEQAAAEQAAAEPATEGSIGGESSAAAAPVSRRSLSLRVGMLAVRAVTPRGADN